jgi:hypothetical protein
MTGAAIVFQVTGYTIAWGSLLGLAVWSAVCGKGPLR